VTSAALLFGAEVNAEAQRLERRQHDTHDEAVRDRAA
jgi:hypothetical protein